MHMSNADVPIIVRPAETGDLAAINAIYNHYVRSSTCTYQEEPETIDARRAWFDQHPSDRFPVLVACAGIPAGEIVGWGALSPYRERSAYRFSVENSVYVRPDWQRRGVGSALLRDLVDRARRIGFRTILAGIDAEQTASIALHAKLGFVQTAHLRQVGFKFGRWLDVYFMQLTLADEASDGV
jgi:phosphinothricin acetyltransferase